MQISFWTMQPIQIRKLARKLKRLVCPGFENNNYPLNVTYYALVFTKPGINRIMTIEKLNQSISDSVNHWAKLIK